MPEEIRCFIAVRFSPTGAVRGLLKQLGELGRAVKPISPENLHLTLKFLGNVESDRVDEIRSAIGLAAEGIAESCVELVGMGVFPDRRRPNVVWLGLTGAHSLIQLAEELDVLLAAIGFAREERPFAPHLTVARIKARPPDGLEKLLTRHEKTPFGSQSVRSVELMQSQLGTDGAKYTVLGSTPLRPPER